MIDIEEIQNYLPHRYPFLLVDRVLDLQEGLSIVAVKNVTANEPFFQGHFPGFKVMPGVLIIESLAQAGGILIVRSFPELRDKLVFLSKVDKAKFRRPVVPGDQLELHVEILKIKGRFCHVKGRALINGDVAAECEIIASAIALEEMNGR